MNKQKEWTKSGIIFYVSPIENCVSVGRKIDMGRAKSVVAPPYQIAITGTNRGWVTVNLNPQPSSTSFQTNNVYIFNLLPGTITDKTKQARLNLLFQATSGNLTISPAMFGLQRIEWYGSTNDLLHTDYGESMYIGYIYTVIILNIR